MKERDNNLDFFRGFAALWIILIHTCFWSGGYYISNYIKSFSLIIDVPLFMFISGSAFNYSNSIMKNVKGIVKLWYKYLIFLILYFIIILIIDIDYFNLNNIINAMFLNFNYNKLMVVEGSFWFIFMYFIVSLLGSFIICLYNKYEKNTNNFKYILLLLFILYGMSLYKPDFIFISSNYLLYLFIYCLGYYLYSKKINLKKFLMIIIGNILLLGFLLKATSYNLDNMQLAKTHNHFVYLVYSLLSINIVFFLKDRIKIKNKKVFVYVGKNALLFYFCQGIGSSLIYFIYPHISNLSVYIIFIIMFITNLLITVLCVFFIKLIQLFLDKFLLSMNNVRM